MFKNPYYIYKKNFLKGFLGYSPFFYCVNLFENECVIPRKSGMITYDNQIS